MTEITALVSGAGIAGPTLAFWLRAAGAKPVLVESAPALRTGGYVIDFWGLGYQIAQLMGLETEINRLGYHIRELRILNGRGRRVAGFGSDVFRELTGGKFVTLARSDLARLLYERIADTTEVLFCDEIAALQEHPEGVEVRFRHARERRFDLVIGADGLHSNVRRLAFGPQDSFEKRLGYMVAAFEAAGYRPRDEEVYVIQSRPGTMVGRFALHDDRTLFLFVFADEGDAPHTAFALERQKAILHERFDTAAGESRRILAELDRAGELYFDRISQIKLTSWSKGRVVLVGDAAFCISLTGGQGSALAMTAAYVLAGELAEAGTDHERAFRRYEQTLRSFVLSKQVRAERFAAALAPRTQWGLWLRNQVIRAIGFPGVARLALSRGITDSLRLPEYAWPSRPATSRT